MKLRIFSVYDQKAQAFMPPFYVPRPEMAMRSFQECANDPAHQFFRSPADYTLYCLGTFDDDSAQFTLEAQPLNLGTALTVKREKQ